MPKIQYVEKNFRDASLVLINKVNEIVYSYAQQGYDLTLRQVYYQLVARAIIPNNERSYKNIGNLINDGRLAGLIDWNSITDRTRNIRRNSQWSTPQSILESVAHQYHHDLLQGQRNYVEVWIEKDALVGVIGDTCSNNDVPYFSCRGYVSQSEMWSAAQRLINRERSGQRSVILHLGDHDPSGIDMTRDIQDRLNLFGSEVMVERIALTMSQIDQYSPPPNPAKLSDARAEGYVSLYGDESWELDALEPSVINSLITDSLSQLLDYSLVQKRKEDRSRIRSELGLLPNFYHDLVYHARQLDEGVEDRRFDEEGEEIW